MLQDFGGSAKVVRELYSMLQPENTDFVSEDEMRERLDDVLKLYLKKKDDDKSGQSIKSLRLFPGSLHISFPSVILLSIGASRHILKFLLQCIKLQFRKRKIVVIFGVEKYHLGSSSPNRHKDGEDRGRFNL